MTTRNLKMERCSSLYLGHQIVADGIRTVLHAMPSLYLAGESFTPEQAAALVESRIAAAHALDAALVAWTARAQEYLEIDDRVEPVMEDLRKLAPVLFGPDSLVLGALGVKAPKRKKKQTAAQQRAAWLREIDEPGVEPG